MVAYLTVDTDLEESDLEYDIAIGNIGNLVYTPNANSEADDSFTFKVSDGLDYSAVANTITVSVNAAPDVTDTTVGTVAAGAASSGDVHNGTIVTDSDDDDSVLVVTAAKAASEGGSYSTVINLGHDDNLVTAGTTSSDGLSVTGTYGTLVMGADGTYTYTASATNNIAYNSTAADTFTFTTRDDESNSGSNAYDVGTITFTVASSISLTNDDDTATEGTPITVTGAQDDVLNDDTADTDGLVVTNISHDNGSESVSSGTTYANGASLTGDYGTLVIGADGSYTFTPNDVLGASETGTDVFTYTADGATATLTITVTGINDAPTALDNSITTNEDTNHVFSTGEFNFSDDDNSGSLNKIKITSLEDNGALQYYNGSTWVDVTENQEITAADITSGYLRFKPDANENGNSYTSFDFQVSDGTAYSSSSSTMTINVTPVNDAPVAANNTGTILEDGTLTVNDGDGANSSGGVTDDGQTADISNEETSVSGLSFNNDGTKMFVSGGQSDTVHEYSLSTAFDVSSKSATANESYSDASNYDWTRGHTWNADGTKLFIIDNDEGESWQKILEHTVQTAFDLSSTVTRTNTYDLVAPSGGSIPTRPKGITFNSDGTKMYIADHATDKIHQFTLSVGFDLTSTVVNSGTLDVSSQNDSPYGVEFSQDGSKVFVVGNGTQGDAVYQYTLNTAWDITSTATYNDSFNLSSQDSVPADIRFNNDGTKMFIAGSNGNEIDEYTLSTPFEIASISGDHDGDVLVDDTDADSGDTLTVTTYSHTSATDEDGSSISSTSSTGTAGTNNVTGYYGTLDLEGDGSYTYTADLTATQALDPGDTVTDVFTYTVDDGNGGTDTATITITVIGVNDTPVAQNDVGVIVEDGTLTVANSANANLSGSYDATGEHSGDVIDTSSSSHTDSDADASASLTVTAIRTGSSEGSGTAGSIGSALTGTYGQLTIAADGSYSYVANQDLADALDVGDSVTDTFNYTLSDGTATNIGVITITILGANDNPTAVNDTGYIKEGGTLTVANSAAASSGTSTGNHTGDMTDNDTDDDASSTATITSITATTASGSAQTTFSSNSETVNGAYGTLTINSDGSYSYAANSNISGLDAGDANITDVFTYIVSDGTATDTATLTINVIASQDLTARNDTGTVNEDATLEVDDGDNANSITATATFVDSFSVSSQDTAPQDLAFNTDGTKMFVVGSAGDAVNEYTLSTGFDVSTATFVHSFSVSSLDTAPQGLAFNTDGTKMFVLGNSGIDVNEYTLSTGFDVSSATFVDSFSVSSQETNPLGLAFNTDGTKMFVSGTSGADVNEYTLSTGFDVSTATFVDSFSVSSQDLAPYGLAFNTDGTKMFVVGTIGDDVNEYTLSTGFDVSTASFVDSFSVSSQEAVPVGLAFNTDGTKMFVVGHEGDDVTEYSLTTPFSLVNVSGEHSGDVINTSSTDNYDTDPDDDTLTITSITATTAGGGAQTTFSSNTETVTGSYGTLTINSNGSYQYAATLDATDALDAGDVVTDVFTYIVSDGQGETDTATITITVIGVNDTPAADAETGSVDISQTLTVTDGTSDLLHGDTDADASASLSVSSIVATTASGSATAVNPGTAYNSGYTSVTGSYGALRVGADGTYQYIASSSSGTDVFTYTLSDGTATHDATLTITINNSAPTASNSTVYINENNQESTAGDRTPSNITKVFAASDFNFSDTDGGSLSKVKITTLESAGDLEYNNGSSWVDVTEDQEITASDISNNKLRFTPAANSESNPTFGFKVHDGTDYSSSAYTMTISVNAAPDVTNATVGSTVAAGATSSGDVHDGVADSDDDNSVLVVTGVASGNESSNNTIITNNTGVGSAVSGTYGSLNIAANGTYTYTASATNNIAYNSTAADTFTFTTRDDEGSAGSAGSHAYDVGTITFTVASSISLTNDDDTATEGTPITVTGAQDDVLNDDTADTDGLVVTNISHDNGSESVSSGTTYANGASLAGDYGTLVIGADGSYTFTPNDVLGASETGTDVFTYTADGATATLTITVTGINDDPVAVNDTGYIKEGGTLTVANSAAASSGTSTGNHTGDMTDNDTDDDASSTATITSITATTASGRCTNNFFK